MPTVHLSIPDRLYDELREVAEAYGIQVTDLIKILVKNGVRLAKNGSLSSGSIDVEKIDELTQKMVKLETAVEEIKKQVERQSKINASMIKALEEKTSNLEFAIEEIEEKVDKEKQIFHPQLIDR
ncbi:MAG: hypothetical protein RXO29_00210 [Desulfurococcales archaeon]|jgi:antitoxin component of RelBE/YafQ-DinJ toxin-antitoxin module|uniref:Uncharacterized protein n=1 Tax=Fervidicoccus fontis TaxID=683846 RepID=A0A7J3SLS1_9CREN